MIVCQASTEVSGHDKNGAESENESSDAIAVNARDSSIDGTDNEVSKNDSDNTTTGKMVYNVGDLASEKQLKCDLYTGTWVKDENYPIYQPGSCPYVDEAYDCQINGRTDIEYTTWRWQSDGCDLPRTFNCTVQFVRSLFLVREGIHKKAQGNSNLTLLIDRIDKTSGRWMRADILVFNTGHWGTHGKTARGINYYKEGDYIYPKFDSVEAYRRAVKTWANWIDRNINPKKQIVSIFYCSFQRWRLGHR